MHLNQLRDEEYKLFPNVVNPYYLAKRTPLTSKTGLQKLVELDRYALRDNTLQTLKEGDLVIVELVPHPKYPQQGYGFVTSLDKEKRVATVKVEYPDFPIDNIDLDNFEVTLDRVVKPVEVYWEQICYRVAKGAASVEKSRGLRRYWFRQFFKMLKNQDGIPGGRILYGAGSGNNVTLFNCFVLPPIPDSRRGISRHRETVMEIMSRGGGVGSNGSTLRPKDALVLGVNGKSSGSVSWLNDLSRLTDLVQQGGSRRGAQMIALADWHPDLIYFIMCKIQNPKVLHVIATGFENEIIRHTAESLLIRNEKGESVGVHDVSFMTGANISVLISDDFMRAVESKGDWTLRFPDVENLSPEQKEFYDKEWSKIGDIRKWEDLGYPVKDYATYRAEELWDLINFAARYSAEPGVIFIDTCNKESNCWYYSPLVVTNPCFTGDMRLLTAGGYKTFAELDGQTVKVVNYLGNITEGRVWKTGEKPTVEVKFSDGLTIRCTPDHRFMLVDGSECEAKDLEGKRVMPYLKHKFEVETEFTKLGYIQGDFGLAQLNFDNRDEGLEISVSKKDEDIRKYFGYEDVDKNVWSTEFTSRLKELGFHNEPLPYRELPSTISEWTGEQKRAFLKGLYSANGQLADGGKLSIKTSSKVFAESLRDLLGEFGISTVIEEKFSGVSDKQESYVILVVNHKDQVTFYNEIGFIQQYKMGELKANLVATSPTVQSVESTGLVEAVYDFHEPETHWGVVEGVVVHNCGEQPLPPYAVCNLSAINLANFYDKKRHTIDYPKLRHTVRVLHRFADNVIDHSFYFLEENEKMAKSERRVGIGVMGLADLLIKLKQRYGSEESLETIDNLFRFIRDEVYLHSTELAEEKGSFPYFDTDKYIQSDFVKRLPDHIIEAIKTKGIRNVCNLTIAPTGSTGTMVGVATGLEPYFSFKYFRSGRLGKHIEVNVEIAQQYFDENPDATELPDYFVSANEITAMDHVKVQATIQKYIDSAISKTCNAPSDFTVEENKQLYFEAWKLGCKGVTVYVDGSRDSQVLSLTKEDNNFDSFDETEVTGVKETENKASEDLVYSSPTEDTSDELEVTDTRTCSIRFENGQIIKEC